MRAAAGSDWGSSQNSFDHIESSTKFALRPYLSGVGYYPTPLALGSHGEWGPAWAYKAEIWHDAPRGRCKTWESVDKSPDPLKGLSCWPPGSFWGHYIIMGIIKQLSLIMA